MRCDEADPLIDAYAEGALDGAPLAPFAAHIETCAGCRAAVDASRRLSAALAAMPVAVPSAAADARTLAAVAEEIAWTRRRVRLRRTLIGAGTAAAAASIAAAIFVAAPAALLLAEQTPRFAEVVDAWLRLRAVPALAGSSGMLVALVATIVAVAAIERFVAEKPRAMRDAR